MRFRKGRRSPISTEWEGTESAFNVFFITLIDHEIIERRKISLNHGGWERFFTTRFSGKYMDILCFIYDWDSPSTSQTSSKEQAAVFFLTGLCRPLQGVQTALAFDTCNSNMACCLLRNLKSIALAWKEESLSSSWLLGALANVSVHRRQRHCFFYTAWRMVLSLSILLSLSLSLPLSLTLSLSLFIYT